MKRPFYPFKRTDRSKISVDTPSVAPFLMEDVKKLTAKKNNVSTERYLSLSPGMNPGPSALLDTV
ncbi:MAG: hypothetical protein NTV68_02400 [Methanomicrobiales archaeon]|nr:hypothetical protein [Methanomicrobiales archaeon]